MPVAAFIFSVIGLTAFADTTVIVGGEAIDPTKDIVDNALNSADLTTLVTAVKAAGLIETLKRPVPFRVFTPTIDASKTFLTERSRCYSSRRIRIP